MIYIHKNALICRLKNRKVIIFKTPESITLQCFRLQEVENNEIIEIIRQNFDWIRVIKLKNKTLVYSFKNITFFPDMFELISQTYFPLQEIDNYDTLQHQ